MSGTKPVTKRAPKIQYGIENAVGFTKHIIGQCADQEDHQSIAKNLWELVEMLRDIAAKQRELIDGHAFGAKQR